MRRDYVRMMTAASGSNDPRLEQVFAAVAREDFMPPGPWLRYIDGTYVETPDTDPDQLYQNVLVALDASKGINNGEPSLHAGWIGVVAPRAGETVCHIGAGTGYYTALLSRLVDPGGRVQAFEIEDGLAKQATANLASFGNVTVVPGNAVTLKLPPADLIYVNAGVTAPPSDWLETLRQGGRMIFPWRPAERIGLTLLISRSDSGFQVKPLLAAWFIPCVGASNADVCLKPPDPDAARSVNSVWLTARRPPDATAVAIYRDLWFSSAPL